MERHQTIGNGQTIERAVETHGLAVGDHLVAVTVERNHGYAAGMQASDR